MSIIVFWLEPGGTAACTAFPSADLLPALKHSEALRGQGMRHVCISTELADSVGQAGVTAVEARRLPNGEVYDFNKSHRGAGPSPNDRKV